MSKEFKILFFIFLIALFLRTFNLESLPTGFHSDEVRVGWNAYSILKTAHDDRGNLLALFYNTFGDYRPTGIFYFTIPSLFIFGLTQFAVRFPSALFGALTIFPVYLLTKNLLEDKTKNQKAFSVGYLSALLFALSPWHILVSRATSEVVISLFFALWGIYFYLKATNQIHPSNRYYFYSFLNFLISFLLYHAIKPLAPLFLFSIFLFSFKKLSLSHHLKPALATFLTISLLSLFFLSQTSARGRLSQVIIAAPSPNSTHFILKTPFDLPPISFLNRFLSEYQKYFSFDFLVGSAALPARYITPNFGLITYASLALLLIAVFLIIQNKKHYLPLVLLLLSPLPAALTAEDAPNLHRSLLMLPFIIALVSFAFSQLKNFSKKISYFIIIFYFLNIFHFWVSYLTRSSSFQTNFRNYSATDLVLYLNEVHNQYEQVIITHDPDDPYPWYAFINHLDPKEFNQFAIQRNAGPWNYQNLTFTQKDCPSGDKFPGKFDKPADKNILVVDGFKCPVESKIADGMQAKVLKQFSNPDGSVAYTLWIKN